MAMKKSVLEIPFKRVITGFFSTFPNSRAHKSINWIIIFQSVHHALHKVSSLPLSTLFGQNRVFLSFYFWLEKVETQFCRLLRMMNTVITGSKHSRMSIS